MLTRSKSAWTVFFLQRGGFLAANPAGSNVFASQFERVLPAFSVANLFPFNYSGNNAPKILYWKGPLRLQHHPGLGPPGVGQNQR